MAHALAARQLSGVAAVEASRALNEGPHDAYVDPCRDTTIVGLAQHHGIPTPLLDWTSNFYVALWFIVDDVMRENSRRKRRQQSPIPTDQMAEIWGVPRLLFGYDSPRLQFVIDQTYPTAQGGIFTYDAKFVDHFIRTGTGLSLEESLLIDEDQAVDGLIDWMRPFRVQFPCKLVRPLKRLLVGMGHCTATLKPSLDNIAKFVQTPGMP